MSYYIYMSRVWHQLVYTGRLSACLPASQSVSAYGRGGWLQFIHNRLRLLTSICQWRSLPVYIDDAVSWPLRWLWELQQQQADYHLLRPALLWPMGSCNFMQHMKSALSGQLQQLHTLRALLVA